MLEANISLILSVASIIGLIWGVATRWGGVKRDIKALQEEWVAHKHEWDKLGVEIKSLREAVDNCKTKIEPFWDVIKAQLPALLQIHGSGNLVEKLSDNTITDEELLKLEKEVEAKMKSKSQTAPERLTLALASWAVCIRKQERKLW